MTTEEYTVMAKSLKSEFLGLFDDNETVFYEIKKDDTRFEKNFIVKSPPEENPDFESTRCRAGVD